MAESAQKNELKKLQSLPQQVQDFLLDPKRTKTNSEIIDKFALDIDQEDLFFDLIDKVIYKEIKLEDFPEEAKTLGLPEEKTKEFALEVLGKIFLSLDKIIGDVSGLIKKLGGDVSDFVVERLVVQTIAIDDLVKTIAEEEKLDISDESVLRRLKNVVLNRFNEIRTDEAAVEILTRGKKVGGLELEKESAEKVVQNILAKMAAFRLAEPETADSLPRITQIKPKKINGNNKKKTNNAAPPDNLPAVAVAEEDTKIEPRKPETTEEEENFKSAESAEEAKEISRARVDLEKKISKDEAGFDEEAEKSVLSIVKNSGLVFSEEKIKQKFSNIISARLRDIRDKSETLDLLTREKSMGGFGLSEEKAEKILDLIEQEFASLSDLRKTRELRKIEEYKKWQEAERKTKEEKFQETSERKIEEKWSKLTGRGPARFDAKSREIPQKGLEENVPMISGPEPQADLRPRIEDIKFTPQLVGPIDELRRLTLADFRRFAKNPADIAIKIKDKVELLEDESHLKKIAGIGAWHESEPARIYFEILRQSLKDGVSVSQVMAERDTRKLPNLTKEEFSAIMKLNKELSV